MSDRASSHISHKTPSDTSSRRGKAVPKMGRKKVIKSHFESALDQNALSSERTTDGAPDAASASATITNNLRY